MPLFSLIIFSFFPFTSSHLHIFISSHPHIFKYSHLHLFTSHIFTSSELFILINIFLFAPYTCTYCFFETSWYIFLSVTHPYFSSLSGRRLVHWCSTDPTHVQVQALPRSFEKESLEAGLKFLVDCCRIFLKIWHKLYVFGFSFGCIKCVYVLLCR